MTIHTVYAPDDVRPDHNSDHEHDHGHDHQHDHDYGRGHEQEHEHGRSDEHRQDHDVSGHDHALEHSHDDHDDDHQDDEHDYEDDHAQDADGAHEHDHDYGRARNEQVLAERIGKEEDWALLTKRLLAFTVFYLSRYGKLARRFCCDADDYVQRTVVLVLTGKRRFPVSTEVSTFAFLCGVVASLVSHDAEKADRRRLDQSISTDDDDLGDDQILDKHLATSDDFEATFLYWDRVERFARALGPRLGAYVRLIARDEFGSAQDYAEALGTTVANIRNMDKQLKRRRSQYDSICSSRNTFSKPQRRESPRMAGA